MVISRVVMVITKVVVVMAVVSRSYRPQSGFGTGWRY